MLPRPDKQHSVPARSQRQLRNQQRTPSSKNHFLLLQVRIFENIWEYFRNILAKFCQTKHNFQLFQFLCLAPLSRRGEEMRTMSIFLQQLLLKMSKRCVLLFSETQNNDLLGICEDSFAEICDQSQHLGERVDCRSNCKSGGWRRRGTATNGQFLTYRHSSDLHIYHIPHLNNFLMVLFRSALCRSSHTSGTRLSLWTGWSCQHLHSRLYSSSWFLFLFHFQSHFQP